MNTDQRITAYYAQTGRSELTRPQMRRMAKKAHRDTDPLVGKKGRLRKRYERKEHTALRRRLGAVITWRNR